LNLWGNAREGSEVPTDIQHRAQPPAQLEPAGGWLALDGIAHSYRNRRGDAVQALAGVSLSAHEGELVAVVGPSGCGKTTLLEILCRLLVAEHGSVLCPPAVLMPQRDLLLPWLSAVDNAALALRIAGLARAQRDVGQRLDGLAAAVAVGVRDRVELEPPTGGLQLGRWLCAVLNVGRHFAPFAGITPQVQRVGAGGIHLPGRHLSRPDRQPP